MHYTYQHLLVYISLVSSELLLAILLHLFAVFVLTYYYI